MKLAQNQKSSLEEFKKFRTVGREELLKRILEVFKKFEPIAIHQFGSGVFGYKDEFSDIDVWFTFKDEDLDFVVKNQHKIFRSIAPVLVKHQSKSWSPLEGSATQIIHETKLGLFQVDYYISKRSQTVIKSDAKVLDGDDTLERGEWVLNKGVKEPHTLKKDVSLLVCLMFISIKMLVRESKSGEFEKDVRNVFGRLRTDYGKNIKRRRIKLNFRLIDRLLTDIYPFSSRSQKKAARVVKSYAREVEHIFA